MKRIVVLAVAAMVLASCGSDEPEETTDDTPAASAAAPADDTPALDAGAPAMDAGAPAMDAGAPAMDAGAPAMDAGAPAADAGAAPAMTTIGALALELPITVPPDIPVPEDAVYIGESETAAPYRAVQFSTAMDAEALTQALEAYATETEANWDPATGQVTFLTELDGAPHNVYAWVRTNEGQTILEIGTIAITE